MRALWRREMVPRWCWRDCSKETISPGWRFSDAAVAITDIPRADKTSLFMVDYETSHRER